MMLRNSKVLALAAAITSTTFLCAQDAVSKPAASTQAQQPGVRYMIKTTSEVTTDRRTLINGEERGGGRGGAGGGAASPVVTRATLIYDEGAQSGGTWRKYHTAEAMVERAGRDGEAVESKIASALAGKKIFVDQSGEQPKMFENDAEGGELDAAMTRDVPATTNLGTLVPTGAIEAGSEFAVDGKFATAFGSLLHPLRAERAAGGRAGGNARGGNAGGTGEEGGARRRRGDGAGGDGTGDGEGAGQGRGDAAPRGQGGNRGQGGGQGGMRGAMGADDSALRLLANQKLQWKGTAKVVTVDAEANVAHVEFQADVEGAGTPDELGLNPMAQFGRMFGGGGRGGAGAPPAEAPAADGEATAHLTVTGKYTIDLRTRRVASLNVSGSIESQSQLAMVREMRGEEMEIESDAATTGTFSIEVSCEAAPASTEKK